MFFFILLSCVAPEQVQRFHGNHSHPDHFKLLETNGDSILVGARYPHRILNLFLAFHLQTFYEKF